MFFLEKAEDLGVQDPNNKITALEYLLLKGADFLLTNYFLAQLKPKGQITEEQRKRLVGFALKGNNSNCVQMVFDDLLGLKGQELKAFITNYNLIPRMLSNSN